MAFHEELQVFINELDEAIESVDIVKLADLCRDGVELIRANEPLKAEDVQIIEMFTICHGKAETLVEQVRDQLLAETGRNKHARKGIKQYKGVSKNV